jgi:hypothetical protein
MLPESVEAQGPESEPGAKVQNMDLGGGGPRSGFRGSKVRKTRLLGPESEPHIDKGLEKGLEEGGAKPIKAKAREVPIPDGFPNDDAIAWAANHLRSLGWDIDARREADRFRDRNLAKGGRYVDWMAAFRTWIKNAIGFAEKDGRKPTLTLTAPAASIPDPWRSRVVAFADPANRYWNATDWGPAPGKPGCEAPAAILAEFGFGAANVVPLARKGAS